MACLNTCMIGSGFLGASILTMLSSNKGEKFRKMESVLDDNQRQIYAKIKNERMSIYVQGLFIGIALAILVVSMTKIDKTKKICLFIVISMAFNGFYYTLYPKSTYMLLHLNSSEQNKAWLDIYREMKLRHTIGFVLGLIGYYIFGKGICN